MKVQAFVCLQQIGRVGEQPCVLTVFTLKRYIRGKDN